MTAFFRRLLPARIPNTGSQQRDHHANERTFLSWTRAGLGFAAMALALDRLDAIDRVLSSTRGLGGFIPPDRHGVPSQQPEAPPQPAKEASKSASTPTIPPSTVNRAMFANAVSASRLCQLLGLWSLGYGFLPVLGYEAVSAEGTVCSCFLGTGSHDGG
ncbi:uncharacterized protein N7482_004404 [Penicillium canariense]|uniref:DUF202 domain-containing protein n=1 Tax=Penicillium canariense TaxID=189055 RepID=A0A9W9I6J9_9EURO|nr:uncharacterized protein N7482_004404 [Penicillium canariense]KAJ5168810.1 hypothetical protein N7482_004404 [Penicillium canariense]